MDSPWVKIVLAISLDGRISFTPSSKNKIGASGDKKVLDKALAWANATLMGAETLRIHKSTCLLKDPILLEERRSKGEKEQPISLVVCRNFDFKPKWNYFNQPINRWLISNKKELESSKKLFKFDRHILMSANWNSTLEQLKSYGISKLALLGGAKLISSLLEEDKIDELQLTLTPRVLGGKNTWIPYNDQNLPINIYDNNSWILKEVEELDENEIMVRYFRNRKN